MMGSKPHLYGNARCRDGQVNRVLRALVLLDHLRAERAARVAHPALLEGERAHHTAQAVLPQLPGSVPQHPSL